MPAAVETPRTKEELGEALRQAASADRAIELYGGGTKRAMGGAVAPAGVRISTACLRRVLEYEPHDLTISVEAGLPWRELTEVLARNRQMIPLDPPFADAATVGGVIAANSCGPRRRLYGSARDLVIGMKFATLEGKIVQSGGMVVKNVAGLDMAKLMIGSFGTLAGIVSVNFKLSPMPESERSFLVAFDSLPSAVAARNKVLAGPLQPSAIDLLSPAAGAAVGRGSWLLAIRAGGNLQAVERTEREIAALGEAVALDDAAHATLWERIAEFTPQFLAAHPDGAVVRASCTLKEVEPVLESFGGPALARAGTGVCYGYFESSAAAARWMSEHVPGRSKAVIEFAPEAARSALDLWPAPGGDLELMRRIKLLFDPRSLLNRGRLYNRI